MAGLFFCHCLADFNADGGRGESGSGETAGEGGTESCFGGALGGTIGRGAAEGLTTRRSRNQPGHCGRAVARTAFRG